MFHIQHMDKLSELLQEERNEIIKKDKEINKQIIQYVIYSVIGLLGLIGMIYGVCLYHTYNNQEGITILATQNKNK